MYYTDLVTLRPTIAWVVVLLAGLSSPSASALFDHSSYDAVLRHAVDDEGYVDYESIRQNSLTSLESYFERLADADLAGWPAPERLAFWINAYNARVIYEIARKPPLKKVSDDFGLFSHPFKIAGRRLSLYDIEHRILRGAVNKDNGLGPMAGVSFDPVDPRIHFALVHGTVGSPKLRNTAYIAETIDDALLANAVAFANATQYMCVVNGRLQMSSLLKWYADDFKETGGVPAYMTSLLLLGQRSDADAVKQLLSTAFEKTLFTYDWTVNDRRNKPSQASNDALAPNLIPPDALSTSKPGLGGLEPVEIPGEMTKE